MTTLPEPECSHGYTYKQLVEILGKNNLVDFTEWMSGQTYSLCDGRKYNHDTQEYEVDCATPHGGIVYPWDLKRYLSGMDVID